MILTFLIFQDAWYYRPVVGHDKQKSSYGGYLHNRVGNEWGKLKLCMRSSAVSTQSSTPDTASANLGRKEIHLTDDEIAAAAEKYKDELLLVGANGPNVRGFYEAWAATAEYRVWMVRNGGLQWTAFPAWEAADSIQKVVSSL